MKIKTTPRPWYATGIHVQSAVINEDNYVCEVEGRTKGEAKANAELIARAVNNHDSLLRACKGLLAQATGPAMVHGDGRGNDGRKTGLSGEEFNKLRDDRLEQARAAIIKATS